MKNKRQRRENLTQSQKNKKDKKRHGRTQFPPLKKQINQTYQMDSKIVTLNSITSYQLPLCFSQNNSTASVKQFLLCNSNIRAILKEILSSKTTLTTLIRPLRSWLVSTVTEYMARLRRQLFCRQFAVLEVVVLSNNSKRAVKSNKV